MDWPNVQSDGSEQGSLDFIPTRCDILLASPAHSQKEPSNMDRPCRSSRNRRFLCFDETKFRTAFSIQPFRSCILTPSESNSWPPLPNFALTPVINKFCSTISLALFSSSSSLQVAEVHLPLKNSARGVVKYRHIPADKLAESMVHAYFPATSWYRFNSVSTIPG